MPINKIVIERNVLNDVIVNKKRYNDICLAEKLKASYFSIPAPRSNLVSWSKLWPPPELVGSLRQKFCNQI